MYLYLGACLGAFLYTKDCRALQSTIFSFSVKRISSTNISDTHVQSVTAQQGTTGCSAAYLLPQEL